MRRLGVMLLLLVFVGTISMPALAAPIVVKYATGTPSHDRLKMQPMEAVYFSSR
ncbi:MAG: hypothetical protein GX165_04870 [Firmicutes bacterium]|nr:hypothetical protein [Bacillota bacterium]